VFSLRKARSWCLMKQLHQLIQLPIILFSKQLNNISVIAQSLPLLIESLQSSIATWFCFSVKARTCFSFPILYLSPFFVLLINVNMIFLHADPTGLIEEYDSPKNLLKDKSSSLAQLVAEYTRRSSTGFGS